METSRRAGGQADERPLNWLSLAEVTWTLSCALDSFIDVNCPHLVKQERDCTDAERRKKDEADALVAGYGDIKLTDKKSEDLMAGKDAPAREYWGVKMSGTSKEQDAYNAAKDNGNYAPLPHPDKRPK